MRIETLTEQTLEAFFNYCRKHRYAHDESYLYEEDLNEFVIGEKNPTYLLYDDDLIVGALSIVVSDYFKLGHRARVRIFHTESNNVKDYQQLLNAMAPLDKEIHYLMMYLYDRCVDSVEIIKSFDFKYYQTNYIMQRNVTEVETVSLPEGYTLKPLIKGKEEAHYQFIRNEAFKNIKGSETPVTLEMVNKQLNESYVLENGTQLLWHENQPIGLIHLIKEEDETGEHGFVAPIALLPAYQGKGLGLQLLKSGLNITLENGYSSCMLCVIAENENALKLYKKAGFNKADSVSTYNLYLTDSN